MSTTPQSQQPSQPAVQNEAPASAAPAPPTTRTVVVTTRPPLIPDEDTNAYCLSRRNIFDAVIALLLVVGIIYFVIQWRKGSRMGYGATGLFSSSGTGYGRSGMGMGTGMGLGNQMNRMGNQIAGALKNFFK